jgi:hypothetical protein
MATTLDKPQAPAPQQTAPPPVEPLLVQCASCGSPIAFDQTYCLECGAKNEPRDGWLARFKTRRYVLGGLAALLAVGGIVGYAAAAASRHDAVKVATAKVTPPPTNQAPATAPPAAPPTTTTPPSNVKPPASPAPAAPPASKPATPPASHSAPAAPSTPTHTSTTPTNTTPHHATPATPPASTQKPAYTKLFSSGRSPVSAGPFDPNKVGGTNAASLSKVFDDDSSTVWESGTYPNGIGGGVGFYVDDGASGTIGGIGLLAKTPGFDVQVYAYNGDTPPQSLSNWTLLGTQASSGQRQKIKLDLKGQQYQLYLLWFTKLPAKGRRFEIPEVQLLP